MQTRKKRCHGSPPRSLIANKARVPLFFFSSEHCIAKPVLTAEILRSPLSNHRHCFFSTANSNNFIVSLESKL